MAGRRALVTGGAQGIGAAIAARLAAEGARLAVADIDADAAAALATRLGPGHRALAVDLTDPAAAAALPGRAACALGGLEIIVNNAGATDTSGQSLVALPAAAFERMVALNLTASAIVAREGAGLMGPGGRIVNLASGAAYRPLALRGPYSATKAAILALTAGLATELGPRGIAVSAVAPGYTRTPLVEALEAAGRVDLAKVAAGIPMGRLARPEDIAAAVAFAASAAGGVLSGQCLSVDGGGLLGAAPGPEAAPAPGRAPQGQRAAIGWGTDLPAGWHAACPEDPGAAGPLAALIDARGLDPARAADPARVLAEARALARALAAAPRARDCALLFLAAEDPAQGATAAAAHAGLGMLARVLALEWAPAGLRINTLFWQGQERGGLEELCRFLTGPEAGMVTGQVIRAGHPPATPEGPHQCSTAHLTHGRRQCDIYSTDGRITSPGS